MLFYIGDVINNSLTTGQFDNAITLESFLTK